MGKTKRFKRIALRCEKTATNYASFLALVCGFILIHGLAIVSRLPLTPLKGI